MNRTLRRTATRVGLTLYFGWLLAVVALLIARFTPGPIPTIVDWVVTGGAVIGVLIGSIRIVYRTPQYAEKLREWVP